MGKDGKCESREHRPPDCRDVELVSRREIHRRMYHAQERMGEERRGRCTTGLSALGTEVAGKGHKDMG